MTNDLAKEILRLKKEKNAIILAHYYVDGTVQDVADYIGDSYYLSKIAKESNADVLVFAGVNFMADSAKVLNPNKTVLLPDMTADCPMAHMVLLEQIDKVRSMYDDIAVVCYINSDINIKAKSDVIVTSANAVKVVKSLPNKNIFFIPDKNLGRYVSEIVKEKNFIFNEGYCPVHNFMDASKIKAVKKVHSDVLVLAHPECNSDVLALADYIGSTSGIIDYVSKCDAKRFYIATEIGVLHTLKKKYKDKIFYYNECHVCEDMKKITLEKIYNSLCTLSPSISVDEDLIDLANKPLERMLELAK